MHRIIYRVFHFHTISFSYHSNYIEYSLYFSCLICFLLNNLIFLLFLLYWVIIHIIKYRRRNLSFIIFRDSGSGSYVWPSVFFICTGLLCLYEYFSVNRGGHPRSRSQRTVSHVGHIWFNSDFGKTHCEQFGTCPVGCHPTLLQQSGLCQQQGTSTDGTNHSTRFKVQDRYYVPVLNKHRDCHNACAHAQAELHAH